MSSAGATRSARHQLEPRNRWSRRIVSPCPLPRTCNDQPMAEPVPAGSDVSSGTYKCTNCGYELGVTSTKHLPPCPSCGNGHWDTLSGGDSVNDPYPNQK